MRNLIRTSFLLPFLVGLALFAGGPQTATASEDGVRFEEARLYVRYNTGYPPRRYYGHRQYGYRHHRDNRRYYRPRYQPRYYDPYYDRGPRGGLYIQYRIR